MRLFVGTMIVMVVAGQAVVDEYAPGTGWQPFSWLTQNLCGGCYINKEPFTFSMPGGGCGPIFQVTDIEFGGERFEVYNNGQWTGFTTNPPAPPHCDCIPQCPYTEDFDVGYSGSTWSSGALALANGQYAIQFTPAQWCNTIMGGTAAFRVVYEDCNCNGTGDEQDVKDGTSPDCNGNGQPDECDIAFTVSGDCNENQIPDECDIGSGASLDVDNNGIPDECECLADINGDGTVGVNDLLILLGWWGNDPQGPPDLDGSGEVGVKDLLMLLGAWGACP